MQDPDGLWAHATKPSAQGARGPLEAHWLGRVPYRDALQLQEKVHQQVRAGDRPDTLLLLEHDPVITTGRQVVPQNLLITEDERHRKGIDLVATGRGGDVTYHGPGQLVGYPIVALQDDEQDIRKYVNSLEELLIRTAADFATEAARVPGLRGIWVGNDKLAAIGIRLVHWVTLHGFALNVATNLEHFAHIVPCGLHGRGVTSFAKLHHTGAPSILDVRIRVAYHAARALGRRLVTEGLQPLDGLP